jgi:hypothetical protein
MVIDNFDLTGISVLPFETNPELLVYPDAVLTFSVTAKALQAVTGWNRKLSDFSDTIYLIQLTLGNRPQKALAATPHQPGVSAIKYVFGALAVKRFYHGLYYNGIYYSCQLEPTEFDIAICDLKLANSSFGQFERKIFWEFLYVSSNLFVEASGFHAIAFRQIRVQDHHRRCPCYKADFCFNMEALRTIIPPSESFYLCHQTVGFAPTPARRIFLDIHLSISLFSSSSSGARLELNRERRKNGTGPPL